MVSCLMGDSTALASAIVRCCLNCSGFARAVLADKAHDRAARYGKRDVPQGEIPVMLAKPAHFDRAVHILISLQ